MVVSVVGEEKRRGIAALNEANSPASHTHCDTVIFLSPNVMVLVLLLPYTGMHKKVLGHRVPMARPIVDGGQTAGSEVFHGLHE